MIEVDRFSGCASPLELYFDETKLAHGTCFFWQSESDSQLFLVTNWHNVTGKNPITGCHLDVKHKAEPNWLSFDTYIAGNLNCRNAGGLPLFEDENPVWLEHPRYGRQVDVVCIPIDRTHRPNVFPVNCIADRDALVRIAMDVYILGYPLKIGADRFPIWKRASIATEPMIDVDGLPKILVDTATAKGMSGSPVFIRTNRGRTEGGIAILPKDLTQLIGVYSGRIPTGGEMEAQLGIVWKTQVIEEIIAGKRRGSV